MVRDLGEVFRHGLFVGHEAHAKWSERTASARQGALHTSSRAAMRGQHRRHVVCHRPIRKNQQRQHGSARRQSRHCLRPFVRARKPFLSADFPFAGNEKLSDGGPCERNPSLRGTTIHRVGDLVSAHEQCCYISLHQMHHSNASIINYCSRSFSIKLRVQRINALSLKNRNCSPSLRRQKTATCAS